jgi:hypothetical protein
MVYGVRPNATILVNPSVQPPAQALYDPVTRRAVRYVETIVPTIYIPGADEVIDGMLPIPADRFYGLLGLQSTSSVGGFTTVGTESFEQWDATDKRLYLRLGDGAAAAGSVNSNGPIIFWAGWGGTATAHAPKNAAVSTCHIKFRARFNSSVDYNDGGIGGATSYDFADTSAHFFQVLRNTTNWELGTCDGATISQTSVAGGDGSFHNFHVAWSSANLLLYVDDVLLITKTTNMPTRPLMAYASSKVTASYNTVDLVDYLVYWE